MQAIIINQQNMKKIKVACLGDSITKGTVSYKWVAQLSEEMKAFDFFNLGKNGDLAYNASLRIDEVTALQPDYVIILLGTNDVNATMTPANIKRYIKSKKLPQIPNKEWYTAMLEEIVTAIKQATNAKIVLCTLPFVGEDINGESNKKIRSYNEEITRLAQKHTIDTIDLYKNMERYLASLIHYKPIGYQTSLMMMAKAIVRKFVFRQNWNTISKTNGLYLTTDTIHLNETGGRILAALVKEYLVTQSSALS